MSNQKHTVATDALETLGTIIDERAGRDAIHLAVEPVEAGEPLTPGRHVYLADGKAYVALEGKGVGIVDPFLGDWVRPGQRFWLVVYPRQITSLRHVWTHPAFDDAPQSGNPSESRAISKKWLEDWLADSDSGLSLDQFIEVLEGGRVSFSDDENDYDPSSVELMDDEYIICRGFDAHEEIPAEVWIHLENVTGRSSPARPQYFTCSC